MLYRLISSKPTDILKRLFKMSFSTYIKVQYFSKKCMYMTLNTKKLLKAIHTHENFDFEGVLIF